MSQKSFFLILLSNCSILKYSNRVMRALDLVAGAPDYLMLFSVIYAHMKSSPWVILHNRSVFKNYLISCFISEMIS